MLSTNYLHTTHTCTRTRTHTHTRTCTHACTHTHTHTHITHTHNTHTHTQHTQAIPACTLELVQLEIRLHGGVIAEQFSEDITHIVFDKQYVGCFYDGHMYKVIISLSSLPPFIRDLSRVAELRRLERGHSRKHHFVTADWVTDSIECEYTKNERFYEPRT